MSHLDHLVYAVPDVDAASEWLDGATGVLPAAGGRDAGLGNHNAVAALGDGADLELIGPDPSQDVDTTPSLRALIDGQRGRVELP